MRKSIRTMLINMNIADDLSNKILLREMGFSITPTTRYGEIYSEVVKFMEERIVPEMAMTIKWKIGSFIINVIFDRLNRSILNEIETSEEFKELMQRLTRKDIKVLRLRRL